MWTRRLQSGQAMENMSIVIARLGPDKGVSLYADWTDRIAKGELPFAKPERPQGVERNVVITEWDWATPDALPARRDLDRQAQSDAQRQRPDLRLARGEHRRGSGARSGQEHRRPSSSIPISIRSSPRPRPTSMGPSVYWGEEPIWDGHTSIHNPMMDEQGRLWFTAKLRGPRQSGLLQEGLGSSRPRRWRRMNDVGAPALDVRPEDRQVVAHQHLLLDPPPLFRPRRQQHAVDQRGRPAERRRRLAQHQDVSGDRRRAEIAGLDADHRRHQRQRQARRLCRGQPADRSRQGQAHHGGLLRRAAEPGRRLGLGPGDGCRLLAHGPARLHHPSHPGSEPVGNGAVRAVRAAAGRLRLARPRSHDRRRGVDGAVERPHGELRPQQVQGTAQRTRGGDRQAMPGRLDALSNARARSSRT